MGRKGLANRTSGGDSYVVSKKFGRVLMELVRGAWGGLNIYYTQVKCRPSGPTKEAETEEVNEASCGGIEEEVEKLKQARAIKVVFFPEWLANTMVVKKKNGK